LLLEITLVFGFDPVKEWHRKPHREAMTVRRPTAVLLVLCYKQLFSVYFVLQFQTVCINLITLIESSTLGLIVLGYLAGELHKFLQYRRFCKECTLSFVVLLLSTQKER
jgi:hypothetical protein